ncbi:MAG: hypothetical protein L0Z51_12460 [Candidatus Latescibacteria bacterium]|nr:hypothetical protein [Candidatus Latescibacterota bacterium]
MKTAGIELAAFFETLGKWDSEDAELFLAQVMWRRNRRSPVGQLARFGCVRGLGALGVWGCGGREVRSAVSLVVHVELKQVFATLADGVAKEAEMKTVGASKEAIEKEWLPG